MSKKCLLRVEELLKKSSIKNAKKDEIINQIKIAQAEKKINLLMKLMLIKLHKKYQNK